MCIFEYLSAPKQPKQIGRERETIDNVYTLNASMHT